VSVKPSAIEDKFWNRLRYGGAPIKQHVLADVRDSGEPLLRDWLWQSFKQHCAAQGNLVPLLISQLEPQDPDPGMFRRRGPRKLKGSEPFGDLPLIQRLQAEEKFRQLCERWTGNLPSWRRAILAGVARRLTLHPPNSEWGRQMRRIKGGVHCQRKYGSRAGIRWWGSIKLWRNGETTSQAADCRLWQSRALRKDVPRKPGSG